MLLSRTPALRPSSTSGSETKLKVMGRRQRPGGARTSAATSGGRSVFGSGWGGLAFLCGRSEADLVTERLELADVVALPVLAVAAPVVMVGAEVVVGTVAGQQMPDGHEQGVPDREGGLGLPSFAEAAQQVPVVRGQVSVVGSAGRPGGLAQGGAQRGVPFCGLVRIGACRPIRGCLGTSRPTRPGGRGWGTEPCRPRSRR